MSDDKNSRPLQFFSPVTRKNRDAGGATVWKRGVMEAGQRNRSRHAASREGRLMEGFRVLNQVRQSARICRLRVSKKSDPSVGEHDECHRGFPHWFTTATAPSAATG